MARGEISIQLDRILELIKVLNIEALSGPQVIERLSSYYEGKESTRKVRDDVKRLRDWGFDIKTRRNPARYELVFNPLALSLTDEHIDALAMLREMFEPEHPLGDPFRQLVGLLTMSLDEKQAASYQQTPILRVSLKMAVAYPDLGRVVPSLKFAIGQQKQVQFEYRPLDYHDHPTSHIVEPYEIEYRQQHLYLVGYSMSNDYVGHFRLDQAASPNASLGNLNKLIL